MRRQNGVMASTGDQNMGEPNSIRVLNEVELRQMLGISERTFDRLRYRGDLPRRTQLSDRRVGYRVIDVEEWLDRCRQSTEEPKQLTA
jgi:predicted DNA-binding transcriptional regulator AlpA